MAETIVRNRPGLEFAWLAAIWPRWQEKRVARHIGCAREEEKEGNLEAAENTIRQARQFYPRNVELAIEAAKIAMIQERWSEAVQTLQSALDLHDGNAPVNLYRQLAKANRQSGNFSAAEAAIRQGQSEYPSDLKLMIEAGELAAARRDWPTASRRWQQACEIAQLAQREPADRSAQIELFRLRKKLAFAHQSAGELNDAKVLLKELLPEAKSRAKSAAASAHLPDAAIVDTCFILTEAHRGWILEKIATVIAERLGTACHFAYIPSSSHTTGVPEARRYFFMHPSILCHALLDHDQFWRAPVYCFHTHAMPNSPTYSSHLALFLNEIRHTFVQNSRSKDELCRDGVDPARISVAIGGADPDKFLFHARGSGKIGYVGGYYERKNPSMLLRLAKALPNERFIVLGPLEADITHRKLYWPNSPIFADLMSQPNIEYREASYADFPKHFAEMDIFLMLSSVEGGPIPLLEAMMANCVPVATDTGFARDVIEDGTNGYLTPVDSGEAEFIALIRKARDNTIDVRSTAAPYTWANFGDAIARRVLGDVI